MIYIDESFAIFLGLLFGVAVLGWIVMGVKAAYYKDRANALASDATEIEKAASSSNGQLESELRASKAQCVTLETRLGDVSQAVQQLLKPPAGMQIIAGAEGRYVTMVLSRNPEGDVHLLWHLLAGHIETPLVTGHRRPAGSYDAPFVLFSGLAMNAHQYLDRPWPGYYYTYRLQVRSPHQERFEGHKLLEEIEVTIAIPPREPVVVPKQLPAPDPESVELQELESKFKKKVRGIKAFVQMKQTINTEVEALPEEERGFVAGHLHGWVQELLQEGKL